jgi:hypothetical protein
MVYHQLSAYTPTRLTVGYGSLWDAGVVDKFNERLIGRFAVWEYMRRFVVNEHLEPQTEFKSRSGASGADEKARFEILFDALRDYQQGLVDNTAKTAGFLLLSIGWLVTSETARKALGADWLLRSASSAAVLVGVVLYSAAALHVYQAARRIRTRLFELSYIPADELGVRTISVSILIVFILGNLVLSLLLAALIWRLTA